MSTLLHIDSSPRGEESLSRSITAEYVRSWKAAHPEGRVISRDLASAPPPFMDDAWIAATFTPAEVRTDAQRTILSLSETYLAELHEADRYIVGAPLYNFGIVAMLKAYIDTIVRVGETFRYTDKGPVGLLNGKRATFVVSSGGVYGPDAASLSFDHVEPYLRTMFGFLGVTDVSFITAGGAAALRQPNADRSAFLAGHLTTAREYAAA